MSGGFDDLGLMPELVKATSDQNWVLPSDVQDESIPLIMGGGDVMVVRAARLAPPSPRPPHPLPFHTPPGLLQRSELDCGRKHCLSASETAV